jgi:hypothetical protein
MGFYVAKKSEGPNIREKEEGEGGHESQKGAHSL